MALVIMMMIYDGVYIIGDDDFQRLQPKWPACGNRQLCLGTSGGRCQSACAGSFKKNSYHPALKIGKISKQAMAMVSVQKNVLVHDWAPVLGEHHHNYQ